MKKKRSSSSQKWLKEHFSDEYVKKAQEAGYRSRAVFKLLEILEKDKLLFPGMNVVDLGAAPGGWSELVAKKVKGGKVIALDILDMEPIANVDFILGDFCEDAVLDELLAHIGGQKIDLVLSDMAPNMSGMKAVDQPRAMYLVEIALDFAKKVLANNGCFLVKVFQGEGFDEYLKALKQSFKSVATRKPKASRGRSAELYLLAKGYVAEK